MTTKRSAPRRTAAATSVRRSIQRAKIRSAPLISPAAPTIRRGSCVARFDHVNNRLRPGMRLHERFRLRRHTRAERSLVAGDDSDALILQNAERLLLNGEPLSAGFGCRFL